MASRVSDLGGLFRGLTEDSRLHHTHLSAKLLAGPAHLSLPAWIASEKLGFVGNNPWLTTINAAEVRCTPLGHGGEVYGQADGEALGRLPLHIRIVPDALHLLM